MMELQRDLSKLSQLVSDTNGTLSNLEGEIVKGVPPVKQGQKLEEQFFQLLFGKDFIEK